jgi:hypothetical protein
MAEPRNKTRLQKIPSSKSHDGRLQIDALTAEMERKQSSLADPKQTSATRSKPSASYSLIGKESETHDEQYIALCKQLDTENRSKRALESQV